MIWTLSPHARFRKNHELEGQNPRVLVFGTSNLPKLEWFVWQGPKSDYCGDVASEDERSEQVISDQYFSQGNIILQNTKIMTKSLKYYCNRFKNYKMVKD